VTIRSAGEEVARKLNVEAEFGDLRGSECLIDPKELLTDWKPTVSLPEGISQVIAEARAYLTEKSAAV
jgi:hypothetical protein